MKTLQSKNYTDPILYEEGFFNDEEEEQFFLNELRKRVEIAVIENKAVKRGTLMPKNSVLKKE